MGITKIRYNFFKILSGSDFSQRRLPTISAISGETGPVLWLTACGHGDEVAGIVVIQEVIKYIRKNGLLKGSLFTFPLMNPMGFENLSRNISFSKEDLNRSFPGNKNGTLAERMAEKIFSSISATQPDLVIDLHNDWINSVPYCLVDPVASTGFAKSVEYAAHSGFIMIEDTDVLHKSLSFNLLNRSIPAITFELGEAYVINEKNVLYGLHSILRIMEKMEMIASASHASESFYPVPPKIKNKLLSYSAKPVCSSSGIIRYAMRPGEPVKYGQTVARVYSIFGKKIESLKAPGDGIILGHYDSSVAYPGLSPLAFGIVVKN